MVDMFHQTQAMLCDFLKEKNQQNSECQSLYNFIGAETDRLPDARYDIWALVLLQNLEDLSLKAVVASIR